MTTILPGGRALVVAEPRQSEAIAKVLRDRAHMDVTELGESKLGAAIFPAPGSNDVSTELFRWRAYDALVIQGTWVLSNNLVPLGWALAWLDEEINGSLLTRKIVVEPGPYPHELSDSVNGFSIVDCMSEAASESLLRAVSGSIDTTRRVLAPRACLTALEPILADLGRYVFQRSEILLIDDDPKVTRLVAQWLCPFLRAGCTTAKTNDESHQFQLWETESDNATERSEGSLAGVLARCMAFGKHAAQAGRLATVVVDIKLSGAARHSGLDIISNLRRQRDVSFAIVVFTGFSSANVFMAAQQLGADGVVQKGRELASHGMLLGVDSGLHRLLVTIANIAFQRHFLRSTRAVATQKQAEERLQQFDASLPKAFVPPRLHDEWQDTRWLLEARALGGPDVEKGADSIRGKYGDAQ